MKIGGIFFRSADTKATARWYREHLGLDIDDAWNGTAMPWRHDGDPDKKGSTIWSPFARDTDYFGDGDQEFMINYRVEDLDATLASLRAAGVEVLDKVEDSEYGRFGWAVDGDGRRFELWQPPEGA